MKLSLLTPLLGIFLITITITSCQKEPSASFQTSKTTVEVNESLTFTNTSDDGDSFEWEFGDGATSTQRSPSHAYSNSGTYTVKLTALSKNEKKEDVATASITVLELDPCASISCLNGGFCANGQCVCTDGYTGANCSQQVTPTQMRVTKIEVTNFPATDNGAGWDLTSGPDIYPTFELGTTVLWESPNYNENANPSLDYEFVPSPAIVINSPNSEYIIRLYDYDSIDADDFMGGISFIPYNSNNGFPTTRTLDAGGGVTFKLTVSYSW
jgi:PKD repeat protein